jgi:hypothetical protein
MLQIPDGGEYLSNQAKKISITISWTDAGKNYAIIEDFVLTNWKPQL